MPWKPSRRAPISTSTMVSPDPITAIDCARATRSGGSGSNGASAPLRRSSLHAIGGGEDHGVAEHLFPAIELDHIAATFGAKSARGGRHDRELDVWPLLNRLEQALAHIFAEELAGQKCVRERLMQAGVVFALIELAKGPVEEIARLARANRKIAGAHVEEMQRMVAAIGDAATEHGRGLDQHQAERLGETSEASDRARRSSEASSDHAHGEWRRPHLVKLLAIQSPASGPYTGMGRQ